MGRPPAPHGTPSAYRRHQRLKEEPCEPCKVADRAARASKKAAAAAQDADRPLRPIAMLPGAEKPRGKTRPASESAGLRRTLQLIEAALETVADPVQLIALSKRQSELVAEIRAADGAVRATSRAGDAPEAETAQEADPFERFFGAGGTSRRPAAAPRK